MTPQETEARIARLLAARRVVLRFLERRVGDRAEAEDLLQTALLKVVAAGDSLRDEARLVPWFWRILRNVLRDHHRAQATRRRLARRFATEVEIAAPPEAARVICSCVSTLLPTLRGEYGAAIRLVDLEDRPVAESAAILGIGGGAMRVRLHRARRALLAALRDACRVCAEHRSLDCACGRARAQRV